MDWKWTHINEMRSRKCISQQAENQRAIEIHVWVQYIAYTIQSADTVYEHIPFIPVEIPFLFSQTSNFVFFGHANEVSGPWYVGISMFLLFCEKGHSVT